MKTNRLAILACLAFALNGLATVYPGSDSYYGSATSPGDDHGRGTEPNDHGTGGELGDDHGGRGTEPNDHGSSGELGDDHGANGQGGQTSTSMFQRTEVRLATTPAGSAFSATGSVDIRAAGNKQKLQVEIEGNFVDGTQFQVLANGQPIGSITSRLQHGELELELENGVTLPGGLLPSAVNSVEVRDLSGNPLLAGRFAAIGGTPASAPAAGFTKTEKTLAPLSASAISVGAAGRAELRVRGAQQEFQLRVDAAVADGTVWQVFVNGLQAGTLTFRLNAAEFKLETGNPLPAGLTSIAAISTVTVTDGTTTLLSANLK